MAAITAAAVKELREITGVAMMDARRPSLKQTEIWKQHKIICGKKDRQKP